MCWKSAWRPSKVVSPVWWSPPVVRRSTMPSSPWPSLGINVRFAKDDSPEAIAALIDEKTKAVYAESIGNPAGNIVDIRGLADVAHAAGVPLVIDNTVATPILCKPIEFGA